MRGVFSALLGGSLFFLIGALMVISNDLAKAIEVNINHAWFFVVISIPVGALVGYFVYLFNQGED